MRGVRKVLSSILVAGFILAMPIGTLGGAATSPSADTEAFCVHFWAPRQGLLLASDRLMSPAWTQDSGNQAADCFATEYFTNVNVPAGATLSILLDLDSWETIHSGFIPNIPRSALQVEQYATNPLTELDPPGYGPSFFECLLDDVDGVRDSSDASVLWTCPNLAGGAYKIVIYNWWFNSLHYDVAGTVSWYIA